LITRSELRSHTRQKDRPKAVAVFAIWFDQAAERQRATLAPPISHEADASEPDQQYREACLGFGDIAVLSRHAFSS
jgi:hypothetical protein